LVVDVNAGVTQSGGAPASTTLVSVFIDVFNSCTGTEISAQATPGAFDVASNLSTATLGTTNVPVFDSISGNTFSLTVAFQWKGVGPTGTSRQETRQSFTGFTLNQVSFATDRNALTASNTTIFGTTPLIVEQTGASISANRSGTLTITH
jgi:hypothetical protein